MKSKEKCSNCAHASPDDICPETLDVIFWCTCHCFETFGSSTCSEFLLNPNY